MEILRQRRRQARIDGVKSDRPLGRAWQAPGAPGSRPLPLSHTARAFLALQTHALGSPQCHCCSWPEAWPPSAIDGSCQ